MRDAWSYKLRCCWRHRAAEPRGLQSQSIFTALLVVAQGCKSYGACSHNLCSLCADGFWLRALNDERGVDMRDAWSYKLRCCWRHRAAEPWGLQSQSIFTALLVVAQGCKSYGACSHNLCSLCADGFWLRALNDERGVDMRDAWSYKLRCCWRHRAAEPWGLQSQSIFTALLVVAQGCRATEHAVTIYVHCVLMGFG